MPSARVNRKVKSLVRGHIAECLKLLGYDLKDPNIKDTPKRVATIWMLELLAKKPANKKLFSVFDQPTDQMVVLTGHKTWTHCPHHLERVRLNVSIAYLPTQFVIGVSKLARIADYYAHGMVLQETYVDQIASGLDAALQPRGVAVYVEAEHMCMKARGVESEGNIITTALRGLFIERPETQREFLQYVLHHKMQGGGM